MDNEENETFRANAFELWAGDAKMTKELVEQFEKHVQAQGFLRLGSENKRLLSQFAEWLEQRRAAEPPAERVVTCPACLLGFRVPVESRPAEPSASQIANDALRSIGAGVEIPVNPAAVEAEDAARWRWLKANHLQTSPDSWIRTGDDLEDAVDAGRNAENRT